MESRESRYWLRFESGERQGEKVPLPEGVASLGRRAGNQLVVPDGSVSGKHAEIRVENGQVVLHDLGSTNGTRVGAQKVTGSQRLAHGDLVVLGKVRFVFLDDSVAGAETIDSSRPDGGPQKTAAALGTVSADRVALSGKRSLVGVVLLAVALGAGAFFAWKTLSGGETVAERPRVEPIPGNVLADSSFEELESPAPWTSADAASQVFGRDTVYARSGTMGLGVQLEAEEWALSRSEGFGLQARRSLTMRGSLWSEDGAVGRLGVELTSTTGQGPPFIAWAPTLSRTDGFEEVALRFDTLPGYDRGNVVVAALGESAGVVSFDDVSVVIGDPIGTAAQFNEFEARVLGEPGSTAVMMRPGRVAFAGIEIGQWGDGGLGGWSQAHWNVEAYEKGLRFACPGAPAAAVLTLRGNATDRNVGNDEDEAFVSTIGPDGYRSHTLTFEVDQAESLLVGRGIDLLRVSFAKPVKMTGHVGGGAFRVRVQLDGLDGFGVQLSFTEERTQASSLAGRASEAERKGQFGLALESWTTLLEKYPFEASIIERAESACAKLVEQGLRLVDKERGEVERASFFGLADLYRQCRARAQGTAEAYANTEVEGEALALVADIDAALAELGVRDNSFERDRLPRLLEALDSARSPGLTEHIRNIIEEHGGAEKDD